DGHGLTGFERVAIPALAHQPVRARELEAPFGGLVSVRRSARPLLVAARVPQIAAPAPLAYLARTHVDPRVRIRPLELGHFARDLDLPRRIERCRERTMRRERRRRREQTHGTACERADPRHRIGPAAI